MHTVSAGFGKKASMDFYDLKIYQIPTSKVCAGGRFARTSTMAGQIVPDVSVIEHKGPGRRSLGLGLGYCLQAQVHVVPNEASKGRVSA